MGRGRRRNTIIGSIEDKSPGKAESPRAAGALTFIGNLVARWKYVHRRRRQIAAAIAYLSTAPVDRAELMVSCRVPDALFLERY